LIKKIIKNSLSKIRTFNYKNLPPSFKCPENVKSCKYYFPLEKPESRCIKDSNVGCCTKELEQWEKEVDDYFLNDDKCEVITNNGDPQ